MKKIISLILLTVMVVSVFPHSVFAETNPTLTAVKFGNLDLEPAFSEENLNYRICLADGEIPEPVFAVSNGATANVTASAAKAGEKTKISVSDGVNTNVYSFEFYLKTPSSQSSKSSDVICATSGGVKFSSNTVNVNDNFVWMYVYPPAANQEYNPNSQWGVFRMDLSKIPDGAEEISITHVADKGLSDTARDHLSNYTWTMSAYSINGAKDSWTSGSKPSVISATGAVSGLTFKKVSESTNEDLIRDGKTLYIPFNINEYISEQKKAGKTFVTLGFVITATSCKTDNKMTVIRPGQFSNPEYRPYVSWNVIPEYSNTDLKKAVFENAAMSEKITETKTEYKIIKLDNNPIKGKYITSSPYSTAKVLRETEEYLEIEVTSASNAKKIYKFHITTPEEAGFSENGKLVVSKDESGKENYSVLCDMAGSVMKPGGVIYTTAELVNSSVEAKTVYSVHNFIKNGKIILRTSKEFNILPGSCELVELNTIPSDTEGLSVVSYLAENDEFVPFSSIKTEGVASSYVKTDKEINIYYTDDDNVGISGRINKSSYPLSISVLKPGKKLSDYTGENLNDVFLYTGALLTDEEGNYGTEVSFADEESGNYEIVVKGIDVNINKTFSKTSVAERETILGRIIDAADVSDELLKTELALFDVSSGNSIKEKFLFDVDATLDEDALVSIISYLIKESGLEATELSEFINIINQAQLLEKINEGKITNISEYTDIIPVEEDILEIYGLLSLQLKNTVSSVMLAGHGFKAVNEVVPVMKDSTIFAALMYSEDNHLSEEVIKNYKTYLDTEEETEEYLSLSETKRISILDTLKSNDKITDLKLYAQEFKKEVLLMREKGAAYITAISFGGHKLEPAFSKDVFSYKVIMQDAEITAPVYSVSNGASAVITNYAGVLGEITEIYVCSSDGENSNVYTFEFSINREIGTSEKNSSAVVASNGGVRRDNDTANPNDNFLYLSGYSSTSGSYHANQWGYFRIDVDAIPDEFDIIDFNVVSDTGISSSARSHLNNYNWTFGLYNVIGANDTWQDGTKPSEMSLTGTEEDMIYEKLDEITRNNMTKDGENIYIRGNITEAVKYAKDNNLRYLTLAMTLEDTDYTGGNATNVVRPVKFSEQNYRPFIKVVMYKKDIEKALSNVVFENAFLTEEIKEGVYVYDIVKTDNDVISGEFIAKSVLATVETVELTENKAVVKVISESGEEAVYTFNAVAAEDAGFTEDGEIQVEKGNFVCETSFDNSAIAPGSGVMLKAKIRNNSLSEKNAYIVSNIIKNGKIENRIVDSFAAVPGTSEISSAVSLPLSVDGVKVVSYIASENKYIPVSEVITIGENDESAFVSDEPVAVEYSDLENDIISISGKNIGSSVPLGVYVLRNGKSFEDYTGDNLNDIFIYSSAVQTDENGYYGFNVSFKDEPTSIYKAVVMYKDGCDEIEFEYAGSNVKANLLGEIIDAANISASAFKEKLGLSMNNPKSDVVKTFILSTAHMTYMNEDNLIGILRAFVLENNLTSQDYSLFSELYYDAVNLEKINAGKENDASVYKDKAGIPEDILYYYNLLTAAQKREFSSVNLAGENIRSYSELSTLFKQKLILYFASVYNTNDVVAKLLSEYTDYLDISSSMARYIGLSNAVKKNEVISVFKANAPYTTVTALRTAFESAVNYVYNKDLTQSVPSGGGGGGGGGGAGPSLDIDISGEIPSSDISADKILPDFQFAFNDLGGYDWAYEAIKALYKQGVVNGVATDKYNPSGAVKREEFIKLSDCLYEGTETLLSFTDINPSAWYIPYINKAVGSGVIKGVSEEVFGIGKNITREDMAVIIDRILGYNDEIGSVDVFEDDEQISEYAKKSVLKLKALGIINGTGNGKFEPKRTVTRAEAAVVIFNVLNFKAK